MRMGGHAAPPVCRVPSSPPTFSSFFLAILSLLFSHAVTSTVAVDNSTDLLKFKSGLNNADALNDWQPKTDPCSTNWRGVLCLHGQVWGLQLEDLKLSGQIDMDSLSLLPMLRTLSFKNNDFQGPMPDWKKLVALKSLYISGNHFNGVIPANTFEGMNYLKKVHIANNEFTGHIPSSLSTPRLLELRIENNKFTGPIPALRDGITSFNVSNNQLEGPIPASLAKMDPSSFSGNKGLCGKPIGGGCANAPDQEIPESPESDVATSSQLPQQPPNSARKRKTSTLKIALMVIAIFAALVLVMVILLACLQRKKENSSNEVLETATYNRSNPSLPGGNPSFPGSSQELEAPPAVVVGGSVSSRNLESSTKLETLKLSFPRQEREKFDLQDLLRSSAEVLGTGNFGSSYKAILIDGEALVVKRIKQMSNVEREHFLEHMSRLGRLHHPNLLPLVAYYYRQEEKLLVFDYIKNGSLFARLHGEQNVNKPSLDWPKRLKIVKGVAKGLLYLQTELPSVTVAHGHLKSANVLLDEDFNPLLMDYSLAPMVNMEQVHQLLVSYKSPEYTQTGQVTKKTDVWCLGILILEILTGKIPPNYATVQGAVDDSVLAEWVKSIVIGESVQVFDPEMGSTENIMAKLKKLLMIGAACCDEDMVRRWDLKLAVQNIEDVNEIEN